MKRRIIYQGIPGAPGHIAANAYFGTHHDYDGLPSLREIFNRVSDAHVDFGVIPAEGRLIGSVVETYDLLFAHDVTVTGEYYLPIYHNLLVINQSDNRPKNELKNLKEVYSHPAVLEQCMQFLKKYPHIIPRAYIDTAGAARYIAEEKKPDAAAIASKEAAELYGLRVLIPNIHDTPKNWMRFFFITSIHREQDILAHDTIYKCTIVFTLPHTSASLHTVIGVFANSHLNLSKIESRPIQGKPFEYLYSMDIEFHSHDYALIRDLVHQCKEMTNDSKVMGYYRKAQGVK